MERFSVCLLIKSLPTTLWRARLVRKLDKGISLSSFERGQYVTKESDMIIQKVNKR
jgi:hypothetical protein